MILDKFVKIIVNASVSKYYEKFGYKIIKEKDRYGRTRIKKGTHLKVNISHLHRCAKVDVNVLCELCNKKRKTSFYGLNMGNSGFVKKGTTHCKPCAASIQGYKTKGQFRLKGSDSPLFKSGRGYTQYKANAKTKDRVFSLSIEQFRKITSLSCHYCGGTSIHTGDLSMKCGIDRIDSSKGYTFENCLPCCTTCNVAKMDMSYKEFKAHIKRMYKHMFVKNVKG
jgi:hypothetical protein